MVMLSVDAGPALLEKVDHILGRALEAEKARRRGRLSTDAERLEVQRIHLAHGKAAASAYLREINHPRPSMRMPSRAMVVRHLLELGAAAFDASPPPDWLLLPEEPPKPPRPSAEERRARVAEHTARRLADIAAGRIKAPGKAATK
jgi:hypothetical protein